MKATRDELSKNADGPLTRLFVARWPDGTAMILSAASMADVADRLDEVGDPGTCEVEPLEVPLALVVRPARAPHDGFFLDPSFDALDDSIDLERAVMTAAFPHLGAMVEQSVDPDGHAHIDDTTWRDAVAHEQGRQLTPSAAWVHALTSWWEGTIGAPAEQSAAAREHMRVTIPGEPEPNPSMRAHFEAEHHRIRERIDAALGLDCRAFAPTDDGQLPPKPRRHAKLPKRKPPRRPGR